MDPSVARNSLRFRLCSRTLPGWVIAVCFAVARLPQKKKTPFADECSNALATCHLESLRVREGGVVGTKSAPQANDSQEDLVGRSRPGKKVYRTEGPRHTPVQQGLNLLGLQHSGIQAERGDRRIKQLRTEPGTPNTLLLYVQMHIRQKLELGGYIIHQDKPKKLVEYWLCITAHSHTSITCKAKAG